MPPPRKRPDIEHTREALRQHDERNDPEPEESEREDDEVGEDESPEGS
jgi:hypothetical protein